MNTARILAIAAALFVGVGSILTAAPASARITANGWNNGWMNGANPGLSTGEHTLRVTGFELPSAQPAK
jgi:hypothetical protein